MELRIDPTITTTDGLATIEDIRELHNAPETEATGEGITVAVMDSGIDPTHPLFDGVEIDQYDFTGAGMGDTVGHGTGCAGLISQLAPDATLVSLRIFGNSGTTATKPIVEAYQWLYEHAHEVDLVNMSWGADRNVPEINRLHDRLLSAGVQDVVAAGNTGANGGSPATAQDAFSVGALTELGTLTRFSSYDPDRANPDLSAIGKDVQLARAEGTTMGAPLDRGYVKASGTSFAAPIVTGLIARYLSASLADPVSRFLKTARDIPDIPKDGEGIVDYSAAVTREEARTVSGSVWSFSHGDSIYLNGDILDTGEYDVTVVEADGEDGDSTLLKFQ